MIFQNPNALWFLFLLGIPIIIHLLQLNVYKKVSFSDTRLLEEVFKKKKKSIELQKILLLLLRLLAFISIIFAFAKPVFQDAFKKNAIHGKKVILFDNHPYTEIMDEDNISAFQQLQSIAERLVLSFSENDEFVYIDNNTSYFSNDFLNKNQIIKKIQESRVSSFTKPVLSFKHILEQVSTGDTVQVFLISNRISEKKFATDSLYQAYLYAPKGVYKTSNISIDSAWVSFSEKSFSGVYSLHFTISNTSKNSLEHFPVRLRSTKKIVTIFHIDCPREAEKTFSFPIELSDKKEFIGSIEIDDGRIPIDNKYYISFSANNKNKVLHVGKQNMYLQEVHNNDFVDFHVISPSQVQDFDIQESEHILFSGENTKYESSVSFIEKALQEGKSVSLFANNSPELMRKALSHFQIGTISTSAKKNTQNFKSQIQKDFFSTVFVSITKNLTLPFISEYYPIQEQLRVEKLLFLDDGSTIVGRVRILNGFLYLFLENMDTSLGLVENSIFSPLMFRISQKNFLQFNTYVLDESSLIWVEKTVKNPSKAYLKSLENGGTFIPKIELDRKKTRLNLSNNLSAGNYFFIEKNVDTLGISINIKRNKECCNQKGVELTSKQETYDANFKSSNDTHLSIIFVFISLFFFFLEGLLSRRI